QLRQNDNGTSDVRFVLIASEEEVLNAETASMYVTIPEMGDSSQISVNRAYRSIIGSGQVITADKGKVFLLGSVNGIPDDILNGVVGHFTLGDNKYQKKLG
ncbi:MAG: hypothetical protein Q4D35_04105, partial [Ruminococcus sp.]|nr:hypothetical protein [Ruminococcus sp.]